MMTYRLTTRAAGCYHCFSSTTQVCEGCENFVCTNCEHTHDEFPRHDLIVPGKPAG